MKTTKTRSIKANIGLMDKFEKKAKKQGSNFNSRIVELMTDDCGFKEKDRVILK